MHYKENECVYITYYYNDNKHLDLNRLRKLKYF